MPQPFLSRWIRTSTPRSREIVLEILKSSHPTPLRSQEIFQRVRKDYALEKVPIPKPLPDVRLSTSPKTPKIPEGLLPPYPDHPIRSFRYLKSIVLEELASQQQIEKVHAMREPTAEELRRKAAKRAKKGKGPASPLVSFNVKGKVDEWVWALKAIQSREEREHERARIQKAIAGQRLVNEKVAEKDKRNAFLDQWGHLNVRRQRARVGKLEREEKWAKMLDRGRREGKAEAERDV